MNKGLYFEICIICTLIIVLLIHNLKKQYTMLPEDRLFHGLLWTAFGLFVSDGIWGLIDGLKGNNIRNISFILNIMYFVMTGLIGVLWLIYTDYRIYGDRERIKKRLICYTVPFAILTVLTVFSPWTGWIFTLSKDNIYARGRYYICQMVIAYGYLIWASVKALVMAHRTDRRYRRAEYRTLAAFTVLPVTGGIAQGFIYGYPLVWAGTAISILMVFINLQNQQMSKDGLTGINNRRYLNRYLDTRIGCKHRRKKLYFILMDIDSFKQINDTYGHTEGDAAIIRLAEILKEVCCINNDFLARYGGDEFAIVCERSDYQEVENLLREITAIIELANTSGGLEYDMYLSIGYAELGETVEGSQDQLVTLADNRLYQVKRERKLYDEA